MKLALPHMVRCALCAGTRDFCPALAALVGSVQNIFSHSTLQCINSFVPITQKDGQAVVPRRLSLNTVSVSGLLSNPSTLFRTLKNLEKGLNYLS
jgi:hypothetical protein